MPSIALLAGDNDVPGATSLTGLKMDIVTKAILDTIRSAGYKVSATTFVKRPKVIHHADAIDPKTHERWLVNAPTAYDAAYELAVILGFDLME